MGLLYKPEEEQDYSLEIGKGDCDGQVVLVFSADCGKFGTEEILDGYTLTVKRLLQILQDRNDYSEEELNF